MVSKRRKPDIPKPRGHTKVDDLYLGFMNSGETKPLTKKNAKKPPQPEESSSNPLDDFSRTQGDFQFRREFDSSEASGVTQTRFRPLYRFEEDEIPSDFLEGGTVELDAGKTSEFPKPRSKESFSKEKESREKAHRSDLKLKLKKTKDIYMERRQSKDSKGRGRSP